MLWRMWVRLALFAASALLVTVTTICNASGNGTGTIQTTGTGSDNGGAVLFY